MNIDQWIEKRQEDAKKKEQASEAVFQHAPQKWQEVRGCAAKLNNKSAGLDWAASFAFRPPITLVLEGHGARFGTGLVGLPNGGHQHEFWIEFFGSAR
jgi:hypothetical protein